MNFSFRLQCVAVSFVLLLASRVSAATYFVDFATGSDTNNGTSTSTPWKHCPGDPNATNIANSTTLTAGDVVNFKGGVKYRGQIALVGSGTVGSRIIYQGQ